MRNRMKTDNLSGRRKPVATLLALALSASLATYGCTTNRMPGEGEPARSPNVGGAPTAIPGSSGGTTRTDGSGFTAVRYDAPRPMYSSSGVRLTADQAAAIMAQHQPARATYLGPSNPGPTPNNGVTAPTGQFSWPALQTNPQVTVNSSISSPATPAIISGSGDGAGAAGVVASSGAAGSDSAAFLSSATAASSADASAAIFSNNATTVTPASAALPVSAGAFAAGPSVTASSAASPTVASASGGTLTPTISSGAVTTPTASLNPGISAVQSNARLGTSTPPTTGSGTTIGTTNTTTTSAAATTRASALRSTGTGAGSVRVLNSNGRVTVTNVTSGTTNGANAQ